MALSNYVLTQIGRMSVLTHTELTDRHLAVLEFAWRYYEKNRVGPLFLTLKKALALDKAELDRLFPHGLNSLYTWVGIPIQTADNTCKPPAKLEVADFREVYLDHNATTYIRREVGQVLHDFHEGRLGFANPSSGTLQGQAAFNQIDRCRETLAGLLGVSAPELTFTSCGTESANTVIKGVAFRAGLGRTPAPHFVCSTVEHSCVLEPHKWLESLGFAVTWVNPNAEGLLEPATVEAALRPETVLVSAMMVNNEIGTINPIPELGAVCRAHGVPLFVDAVQAFGKMPLRPREWGVSFLAVSGHKIYAPKGVGLLWQAKEHTVAPLLQGGGQENGHRSGTENVGYLLALTTAAELAYNEMEREGLRLRTLRDWFLAELRRIEPGLRVNGSLEHRSDANLSVAFPGIDTGSMLLSLNNIGVSVSAGSACSSGKIKTSHVLSAIGADRPGYGTIRFSLGLNTNRDGLNYVLKYLPEILAQIKE
ncbi:MAG: aminotransferase class V-fold PLP-dependent enzyme [Spirochaetales bacterium]